MVRQRFSGSRKRQAGVIPDRVFRFDRTMSASFQIALLGFAPNEQAFFESVFQMPRPDVRPYERVQDAERADLIIVNADDRWTARNLRLRGPVVPVLLIGTDDAGTGWPMMPRPLEPQALLSETSRLLPAQPAAATEAPEFAATQPFAPLQASGRLTPGSGFEETRPFERQPAAGASAQRPLSRTGPTYDSIDAHSLLSWRDGKTGAAGSPTEPAAGAMKAVPASLAASPLRSDPAQAGVLPMAGFEATREAESQLPDKVPANWQELARQRDAERRRRAARLEAEPINSSFADPSDHPKSPPAPTSPGRLPAILLVGGARLAGSSLIRELRGLGCQVDHAQDSPAALERLSRQAYGFAILDDRSLKRQTRSVCRALRRRARALGLTLNIMVLARDGGPLRRLLARWAGCDAWLTLPLERERLSQYLLGGSGPTHTA